MLHSLKNLKIIDWTAIAFLAIIAWVVWHGFSFSNPFYSGSKLFVIVPLFIKLLIPFTFLAFVVIYVKVRAQQLKAANAALLVGSGIVLLILLYPIIEAVYLTRNVSKNQLSQDYHPYLQLSPYPFAGKNPKPKDEFRIFCLGGSTTEFKDSNGRGWPSRVQEQLQKETGNDNIRVYNMGRQWYTTLHTLINYEVNLRQLQPDLIIVMHTINDLLHNAEFSHFSRGAFREDYGHFYGPVKSLIERKSLWSAVGEILENTWYYTDHSKDVTQQFFPGLEPFKRNINTVIDLAKTDGIPVVLMTQPSLYHDNLEQENKELLYMLNAEARGRGKKWAFDTVLTGFEKYTEAIKQISHNRHATLIDLASRIEKEPKFFKDDVHYTDEAFDVIGNVVESGIRMSGLLGKMNHNEIDHSKGSRNQDII